MEGERERERERERRKSTARRARQCLGLHRRQRAVRVSLFLLALRQGLLITRGGWDFFFFFFFNDKTYACFALVEADEYTSRARDLL